MCMPYHIHWCTKVVGKVKVKFYAVGSRHSMNFPSSFIRDTAFPFTVGEDLIAKIEGSKIVIERSSESSRSKGRA